MNFFNFRIDDNTGASFIIIVGATSEYRARDIVRRYCEKLCNYLDLSTLKLVDKYHKELPDIVYIHETFSVEKSDE